MRQTVSEANKYLRQTVKSVEAGGVATLAQAMEHPGTLQEVHVTTLDAADAEIPAAAGFSEGVKLPTRIETKKLVIVGKFPIATQAEYDALSDVMKDKAVILNVTECPIGSEVKAIECNTLGVPVDAHMWIMGADGWKGGSSSTLNPDGSTSFAGPLRVEGDLVADAASFAETVRAPGLQLTASSQRAEADLSEPFRAQTLLAIGSSTTEHCSKTTGIMAGTAGFFELDDGPLAWGKSRYGLPLDLVYNGAVGGTSSEQIFASRVAMLAAGAAHPGAWCWLQFGATDMQNGSITAQACFDNYALPATQDCRAAGHRVALIIPHMTITATPARIANVVEYERLCCELADRDPANIVVISLFRHVSAPFGGYSPALLLDPINGVHLSVEGAMAAAPAFEPFARFMPAPEIFSPSLFGTPINADPNCLSVASLTLVNATAALAPRSMDGRAGIDVTASAAGVAYMRFDCAMPLNQSFRVIADIAALADGVISMDAQARSTNSGEIEGQIGGAVWNTSEVGYVGNVPIGTRRRLVTSRHTATTTPANRIYARFNAAGAGAKVRLRSLGVVRVDA